MISVIIPVYRVEPYLDRCVQSIVEQTYTNLEIILVDDGSPDHCPAMCDAWAERDSRIKVVHKKNGGLSDARNAGMKLATGEYIVFVDSDDWVSDRYVQELYEAACATGSDICECEIIKTDGKLVLEEINARSTPVCYAPEKALELLIQDTVFHQYVWNKIYRNTCLKGISFLPGKINEDEFWTYQIFGRANRVTKIEKRLYYYFQRSGSIMNSGYSLKRLDALEAKLERQAYIDCKFPALGGTSRANLLGSCVYSGQMALLHMKGPERDKVVSIAEDYFHKAARGIGELPIPMKQKVWLALAERKFVFTCKVRNQLRIGF